MKREKKEIEETKNEILIAALDVFDKKSFDSATLEEIAKQAGLSRGSIYWHFGNKFDLLKELTELYVSKFLDHLNMVINSCEENAVEVIRKMGKVFLGGLHEDTFIFKFTRVYRLKISFSENVAEITNQINQFQRKIITKLEEIMKTGQQNKEIRTDISALFLAFSLVAWYTGYEKLVINTTDNLCSQENIDANVFLENTIKFIKA